MINTLDNTNLMHYFDLKTSLWNILKPKSNSLQKLPPPIDSHASCQYYNTDNKFYWLIFGGFSSVASVGGFSNKLYRYDF